MWCKALEESRGTTRAALWVVKRFLRRRPQRPQNLLGPASRKINDKRLNPCRRFNVDFVGLSVVQDKITLFVDREPGTVCTIQCVSVEHAFHRKQRTRRKAFMPKSPRHKKRCLL